MGVFAHKAGMFARLAVNARRPPAGRSAPLVTVVIPTFNWSSVLRHPLRSALWQTHVGLEVLVIGDACTDDSEQVVASFGDPRVRWHNLPSNSGSQSGPNNAALELARGEYVAYLGHDDVWHPTHLAWLLSAGSPLAHTTCEWLGPGGRFRMTGGSPPSCLMHATELGREIGWRDYRELVEGPDLDFVERATARAGGLVRVPALTAFKFPSAYRPNSYVEKPSHEQAEYLRRIEFERGFLQRELILLFAARFRHEPIPVELPPNPGTPGWYVTEYRKIRGLE
jgi:glycosyltransferase involved in cell wall biosynthesis